MKIRKIDFPLVENVLFSSAKQSDLDVIEGANDFFVQKGEGSMLDSLYKLLWDRGNLNMTEDYLNCGNFYLEGAARNWPGEHGFKIEKGSRWSLSPEWGSKK